MNSDNIVSLLPTALALVAMWVKLNGEIERVKGRLYVLESERTEIKTLLKELQQGVEDIRLHMARQ